jgi:hypothetical protein
VFDVLANDFTVPGDLQLSVTDVSRAAHGTVTLTDGVVRYTPDQDYFGPDSFTYTVSDGRGGLATATVSVTVAGRPRHHHRERHGHPVERAFAPSPHAVPAAGPARGTSANNIQDVLAERWWDQTWFLGEDPLTGRHRRG